MGILGSSRGIYGYFGSFGVSMGILCNFRGTYGDFGQLWGTYEYFGYLSGNLWVFYDLREFVTSSRKCLALCVCVCVCEGARACVLEGWQDPFVCVGTLWEVCVCGNTMEPSLWGIYESV